MNNLDIKNKLEGFIVGMAIGDTLGAIQEGLSKEKKENKYGYITDYLVLKHHEKGYRPPYSYTDDTQLALLTIDSFIQKKRIDPDDIAKRLIQVKSKLRGAGRGTKKAIENLNSGINYTVSGQERPGNSPALRCSPLGIIFIKDHRKINSEVKRLAKITHINTKSIAAASLTSHCVNYLFTNGNLDNILSVLSERIRDIDEDFYKKIKKLDKFQSLEEIGTSSYALESVPSSLYLFLNYSNDIRKGMLRAVNSGGDSDSIGALTGAFYGAFKGYTNFPLNWKTKLNEKSSLIKRINSMYEVVIKN
jgi:ADP-ribosyl-[dinitrogen reductase] hydrolase